MLVDWFLPGEEMEVQELDLFYNSTVKVGRGRRPTYEDRKILLLTNGEFYRVGKFPEKDYLKGQKIRITKALISNNVSEIIIVGKIEQTEPVGILSYWYFIASVIGSIAIAIMSLRLQFQKLNILLVGSFMFMSIFFLIYMFYF